MTPGESSSGADDDHLVSACPECDTSKLAIRTQTTLQETGIVGEGRYRCCNPECGERFDDPVRRAPKGPSRLQSYHGLAKTLLDMDPDDVPALASDDRLDDDTPADGGPA